MMLPLFINTPVNMFIRKFKDNARFRHWVAESISFVIVVGGAVIVSLLVCWLVRFEITDKHGVTKCYQHLRQVECSEDSK